MTSKTLQQFYTQLPQSLSDSDSEKESQEKHNDKVKIIQHNPVVNPQQHGPMSTLRKIMFALSVALCFAVAAIFLWVLPCSSENMCQSVMRNWKKEYNNYAFEGPINIIRQVSGESQSFLLMVKNKNYVQNGQDGVIALKSSNGDISWFIPQMSVPKHISCDLLDVNNDQIKDCLVLGNEGLVAIDPLTSKKIWYAHNNKMVIWGVDFPIVLPDLNSDRVNDLLTVTNSQSQHNKITLLCGKTGKILTEILLHTCESIRHFNYINKDKLIVINCWNISDSFYKITLNDLHRRIYNSSHLVQSSKIHFNNTFSNLNDTLNNRRLIVENKGTCPTDCTGNMYLINADNQHKILDWSRNKTFISTPIPYSFKTSKKIPQNFNGELNGFIVKLWQWQGKPQTQHNMQRNLISERVMVILFSDKDVRVFNISYTEIVQLCRQPDDCQPLISAHSESLTLADLDCDGLVELVNYYTTFNCSPEKEDSLKENYCYLLSKLEVIKLESELPKLFAK